MGEFSRANQMKDRAISLVKRKLAWCNRQIERGNRSEAVFATLRACERDLNAVTKMKLDEFAQTYERSANEVQIERLETAKLQHRHLHQIEQRESSELFSDRARGAILGLAVGEALGVTFDGFERDAGRPMTGLLGFGKHDLKAGQWGSATACSLALMHSLTLRRKFDPTGFVERMCDWKDEGAYSCTGTPVGMDEVTATAIATYQETGDPFSGDEHPDSLGAASLTRLAPVVIAFCSDRTKISKIARQQSRVTHASEDVLCANEAFAMILANAIGGERRSEVLAAHSDLTAQRVECLRHRTWSQKKRDEIESRDNVNTAIEAAMWCVAASGTFSEAVLRAANLAGRSAVIGALTGQLAGALYGASSIPREWLDQLAERESIADSIQALLDVRLVSSER